jgi:hypothetical protein
LQSGIVKTLVNCEAFWKALFQVCGVVIMWGRCETIIKRPSMSEKILVASDNIESYQRAILSHPLHQFDLICVSDLDELFVRWNEGDRDYLAIFIEHNNDKFDFKKIAQQLARVNNSSHLPIIAEVPTSLIGMLPDDVRATADAYYTPVDGVKSAEFKSQFCDG